MDCHICGTKNAARRLAPTPYSGNSYVYHPPSSNTGYYPPSGDAGKNRAATAGLVLGISGITFCWLSFLFGLIFSVGAVVFSAIGMRNAKRGPAIAGLVCGLIGTMLEFIMTIADLLA